MGTLWHNLNESRNDGYVMWWLIIAWLLFWTTWLNCWFLKLRGMMTPVASDSCGIFYVFRYQDLRLMSFLWQAAWKAWGEISCEISWKSQTVLLKKVATDVMVIQSSHQAMVISSQTCGPRQQKLTTLCRSIRHIMQYIRYPPAIKHGLLENLH